MITKISRGQCIIQYPELPLRGYNVKTEEDIYHFPETVESYIVSLPSKTFRGNATQLGNEVLKLARQLDCESLVFLGDSVTSWLYQENEYPPAIAAQEYLKEMKVGKRFNGGLSINQDELPKFIQHLSWLTRCNATLPDIHFTETNKRFLGHVCKYGDLHVYILQQSFINQMREAIAHTKFQYYNLERCYNRFGKTSAISGRKIVL
jgi:hypothetical protein